MFLINLASLYVAQLHIFWKSAHALHWKQPGKGLLEIKRLWKIGFLGCFSIAKTDECALKVGIILDQFGITIPCSATYFVEVAARDSLKVATKGSIKGKKTLKMQIFPLFFFSKNGRVRPKSLNYFWSISHHHTLLNYIFSGSRCTPFIELATKGSIRRKKTLKV